MHIILVIKENNRTLVFKQITSAGRALYYR